MFNMSLSQHIGNSNNNNNNNNNLIIDRAKVLKKYYLNKSFSKVTRIIIQLHSVKYK